MFDMPEPKSYFICSFNRNGYLPGGKEDTRIFIERIRDSEIQNAVPKFLLESVETEYDFVLYPCILSSEFYDPNNVNPHIDNEFLTKLDEILSAPHVDIVDHNFHLYNFEYLHNGETNWEWMCRVWNYMNPAAPIDLDTVTKPDYRVLFSITN